MFRKRLRPRALHVRFGSKADIGVWTEGATKRELGHRFRGTRTGTPVATAGAKAVFRGGSGSVATCGFADSSLGVTAAPHYVPSARHAPSPCMEERKTAWHRRAITSSQGFKGAYLRVCADEVSRSLSVAEICAVAFVT